MIIMITMIIMIIVITMIIMIMIIVIIIIMRIRLMTIMTMIIITKILPKSPECLFQKTKGGRTFMLYDVKLRNAAWHVNEINEFS